VVINRACISRTRKEAFRRLQERVSVPLTRGKDHTEGIKNGGRKGRERKRKVLTRENRVGMTCRTV